MSDRPDVGNDIGGEVHGPVVQAGSIGHLSLPDADPVVPRQLPVAVRGFTGRVEYLAALDALLPEHDGEPSGIAAVDGTAGVGKTALVVRWGHRVRHRFPDGTLYADLRGYGPDEPVTPGETLGGFLGALGRSPERIPAGVQARTVLYRSLLAERRVLIVLDNADTADQVRPLLPGAAGCVVVVTSRAGLDGLAVNPGATRITLDLFTEAEALDLVRTILGPQRAEAEAGAVSALIRMCARLPLALRIALARVTAHPHLTVADLVAELEGEQGPWETLSVPADPHTAVRTVLDWSYHRLTDEQARMLRRLGLHPGPEIGVHAAAAVAGVAVADARRLLAALAVGHLIEPVARDRYRFHDLLRGYAADRADRDDTAADRDHARRTLLEWYAHHGRIVYRILSIESLGHWQSEVPLDTGAFPEITFTGPGDAWAWAMAEYANFVPGVRAADRHGLHLLTAMFAELTAGALAVRGLWDDMLDICRLGLAAARRSGDRTAECHLLRSLGLAHEFLTRWAEAGEYFQAALALARELGNPRLHATTLSHVGYVCAEQKQYAEAHDHLRTALALTPESDHGVVESHIEGNLSVVCTEMGDYDEALRRAERCLTLLDQSGHGYAKAYPLYAMARARQGAGAHAEVIALCEQALDSLQPPLSNMRIRALILDTLGTSLLATGNSAQAITCWREALATLDDLNDHHADELRGRLRALETGTG